VVTGAGDPAASAAYQFKVDTTAPSAPTVNALTANNTANAITIKGSTGTTGALAAGEQLTVKINGITYTAGAGGFAVPAADGTWSLNLAAGTLPSVPAGINDSPGTTYNVVATVTDAAGNSATDSTTNELTNDDDTPDFVSYSGPLAGLYVAGTTRHNAHV
jgi:hypothetical protein